MYAHELFLILMFVHIFRNCETALLNRAYNICLWYCRVYLFCSITRTGCYIDPFELNPTIIEYYSLSVSLSLSVSVCLSVSVSLCVLSPQQTL